MSMVTPLSMARVEIVSLPTQGKRPVIRLLRAPQAAVRILHPMTRLPIQNLPRTRVLIQAVPRPPLMTTLLLYANLQ